MVEKPLPTGSKAFGMRVVSKVVTRRNPTDIPINRLSENL
jgi:hypothetical protein